MSNETNKFAPYYAKVQAVADQLQAQPWFTDNWAVVVKYYGEGEHPNPGFTLLKTGWAEDRGIHFESWVGNADLKRSAVPIAFHFETSFERSRIRRGPFYAYLLEHGKSILDGLEGYTLSPKSAQFLINRKPFTEATIVAVMVQEYSQLQALGTIIDAAIEAVIETAIETVPE